MNTVSSVAAAVKLLTEEAEPSRPRGLSSEERRANAVERSWRSADFFVDEDCGPTREEAVERFRRATEFHREARPLGWGLGGLLAFAALFFGGRHKS
jgi:hypothetical protein